MDVRKIDDGVSVSPQIAEDDLASIRERGFRSVICNRPDGEAADQPPFADIEAAAKAAGLEARYLPVTASSLSEGDVESFGAALREMPGPVLAYCRSGTRSAMLWSLAAARSRPVDEILAATRAAGYDMTAVLRTPAQG